MTSAKKLLYQSILLVTDNFCIKFHDVTISSSKVIEGAESVPTPRFFYLQLGLIRVLGLRYI